MRAVAAAVSRRNVKSALGYSARIRWGALEIRSLAITVDVGHGKGGLLSPVTTARSPEQERAALSEFTRMTKATRRLLGQQSLTRSSVQELRVVFHYWVGTRSRKILAAKHYREKALKEAEELLEWMMETQNYPSVLQHVFRTDDCASGAIINMVEKYLMPFRGTHQSFVAGADRRLRFHRNVAELKNALLNATKLMDRLQLLHDDPTFTELVPDRFTCNMSLNLWVKRCLLLAEHGDSMDNEFVRTALKGVSSVEECLEAMQACQNSLSVPNDVENGTLFLSAWVNSGLPNRAKEAHALLRKLEHDSPSHPSFTAAYNAVLYAYASLAGRDKTNASHALDLFRYMQTKGIECDTTTYSTVLLAYANSGNPGEAMDLLSQMEEQAEKTQVFPNNVCYNIGKFLVIALSNQVRPIIFIFSTPFVHYSKRTVLESLGKRETDDAPQQADALLQRMQQMYDEGLNPEACPDMVSFTSVIRAWARSSSPQAAEKAEALLIQCRELSGKNKNVTPDIIMYNSVLGAWARDDRWQRREVSGKRADDTRARRAESLLHQMKEADEVRPDACSYNIVMNAWFRSGKSSVAARRARELFDEAKRGYLAGDEILKPDLISYNTLIKSISKSGMPGCFNEVRSLIKEMEREGYKPDTITYHSVMYSMVKSGARGAVNMVEDMVDDMEQKFRDGETDVRPNEITFNILLHAYAMSNDPDSAVKAEKVLGKMIALSEQGNRKDAAPSLISFTTVMDAYAKTGQAEAAESLFHKLKGFKRIGANAVSYNTVLNAWAKSKDRDAPRRAEALLNHMQEEYESGNKNVRPNQIRYVGTQNFVAGYRRLTHTHTPQSLCS